MKYLIVLFALLSSCSAKKEAYYVVGQFICSELGKDKDTGVITLSNCETLNAPVPGKVTLYNPVNFMKIEE